MKKALLTILFVHSILLYAQTVITEPNPVLRHETRFAYQDLLLQNIDTTLENFHRYAPIMNWKIPHIASNMGNAPRPLQFDIRNSLGYSHGYHTLDNYFLNIDSVKYYDTKTPFTSAEYDFGIGDESFVKLTHAQNIRPNWNVTVDYQRPSSKGFYNHQKSGIHNFSLSQWYQSPQKRYNLLSAYVFNQSKIQENGGVAVDDIFTNPAYAQDQATAPTYLDDATNKLNDNTLFFLQTFGLGNKKDSTSTPSYQLGHRFEYNARKIWYKDEQDSTSSFYTDFFIYGDSTRDFTQSKSIKNELFLENRIIAFDSSYNFQYAWKGGLRYIANKHTQNSISNWKHGLQLFGEIHNKHLSQARINYGLSAAVELAPSYQGDFLVDALLEFRPNPKFLFSNQATINLQSPSMMVEKLYTNHFQWKNKFKRQFSTHLQSTVGIPDWNTYLGVDYYLVQHYIYYNTLSNPSQLEKSLQVIRLFGEQNFYLKNFVFKNKVGFQMSNHQNIIRQPKVFAKGQWYYRGSYIKKKPLHAQLGIDITYFDNHYADAYNPALMTFYIQENEKLKFYPLIDVFFNLQVKRTRIFLVMQHINQGLFKEKGYYVHPSYPATPRALRVGVSWQFYD